MRRRIDKDAIAALASDGREIKKQIVEGNRDEHGKEKMPAFKAKLSDDEIKSIVTVVKDFSK